MYVEGIGVNEQREWIIRNSKGRKFVYDSAAEAFGELDEYGPGATVLTRRISRGMFRKKPIEDWQVVESF
ncbi:hypothetical protein J7F03_14155 [Streptomyces sp. ISL-43]|uniref:hypothetical protein n=1 Tax=Streptomyces sp. ISL-43 TaxID=2819183 RepID=UPI001BEB8461|nr:hypothetical protein [Streptomyces sp. ISL-43]MBT2448203.1 hypothetical protein [Streptomyces sp. ISL-43]